MAALQRHRPRPLATFTHIEQKQKYQYIRMKDMLRSALGAPHGGGSIFSSSNTENMGAGRSLTLGMMGAPNSATTENFPGSAGGMGGFGAPMSAGLEGPGAGSRRQSSISMAGGPRQILPGQLPGPGPQQRKGSMASVASVGAS